MDRNRGSFDFILTFSSPYKAMYARDKLQERGIGSRMQKTPAELFRTCGQSLLIQGWDLNLILAVLAENQIDSKGVFQLIGTDTHTEYRRIR